MESDTIELVIFGSSWLLVHSALPSVACTCQRPKYSRMLKLAGLLLPFATAPLLLGTGAPNLSRWFLPSVALLFGLLPALVILFVNAVASRVHPRVAVITGALLLGCVAAAFVSFQHFLGAADGRGDEWTIPESRIAQTIEPRIAPLVADNFTLSAANGAFIREPKTAQPIHELAVWIFSQRLGGALQPMMKVFGAQTGIFLTDGNSIEVVRAERADDTFNFRVRGRLHLDYLLQTKIDPSKPGVEKSSTDDVNLRVQGVFDPSTNSIRLDSAEVLPPSPPHT